MKKILLFLAVICYPGFGICQNDGTLMQRNNVAIEKAFSQAKQMQSNFSEKNGLSVSELRNQKGIDPSEIAAKYQKAEPGEKQPEPELLIFISTSIPKKALVMLGKQASATGAVLVLRGLKGPLGTRGVVEKTMEALQPIAETGASIQIDPELFGRHNVTEVPTFVMTIKTDSCGNEQCDAKSHVLAGDVTLDYALEEWSKRGGSIGSRADQYLNLIKRGD